MLIDEFEAEHKVQLDRPEVVKRMHEEFLSRLSTLDEISPIAQIARERKGIVPMAVASGGARAIVTATLEATQFRPLFDEIVTMDDVTRGKPFPDLFLEAARRLRMNPSDCLVFEDTGEGLLAAQRAGMAAIDVRSLVVPGVADGPFPRLRRKKAMSRRCAAPGPSPATAFSLARWRPSAVPGSRCS